jgi:hypothetical protein
MNNFNPKHNLKTLRRNNYEHIHSSKFHRKDRGSAR